MWGGATYWLGESSSGREACHPSESKTCSSCVHFQNILAESCFILLAQILACLKINKDRGSDWKFHLRQNMQEKKDVSFFTGSGG